MKRVKGIKVWLIILLVGTLALLPACDTEEEASRGLFYRVEGGDNDIYLFGTIHFGNEDMYPLHDEVYDAFGESDVLCLELDMTEISDVEMSGMVMQVGMYQDDTKMTDVVSEETFEEFFAAVEGPGVDRNMLNRFKPWLAAMELSVLSIMKAGYNPEMGVEGYLTEKAEERGDMEVMGLETIAQQLSPYAKLSDESQAIYLENTLQELDKAEEVMDDIISSWKIGNVEQYAEERERSIEEAETDSLRELQIAFLDDRDKQMTDVIEELLHDDSGHTYFAAVGSLHLAGENSIVHLLEDRGYDVVNMY